MVPSWTKEASKLHCIKKECILRKHPYFWKGMIKIAFDNYVQHKEGHLKL